jgi:hypothetical protein
MALTHIHLLFDSLQNRQAGVESNRRRAKICSDPIPFPTALPANVFHHKY